MVARRLAASMCGLLTACGTTYTPLHELKSVQPAVSVHDCATLTVARGTGFSGAAVDLEVSLDGVVIGTLAAGTKFSLRVACGRQLISTRIALHPSLEADRRRNQPPPGVLAIEPRADRPTIVRIGFDDLGHTKVWEDLQ